MDFTYEKYKNYVYPNDQWYHLYITSDFYEHFNTKYKIFKKYNKKSMAEIGVRFGYSLYAFCHANPDLEYDGFDIINGGHGGQMNIDTFEYVKNKIPSEFPNAKINLHHSNTQILNNLIDKKYDYIHIDGDHSYNGCYHDMEISYKSCNKGAIIHLDDYSHTAVPDVKRAIDDWIKNNSDKILNHYYEPSLRGEYIIELL